MSQQEDIPKAALSTESFRKMRPDVAGSDVPSHPYPVYLAGTVERGFGRGGKELGCPTGLAFIDLYFST
jgi:riboflavin kinase